MMNMPLTLALIMPGMVTKAKTKLKLTIEKKTMAVGQTYKLQLKGVSGTKKKVKQWKITGKGADYFRITDYGLLQMDWEPTYIEPCVTAKVTAILEDGRKLTAAVKAYSELNIYMDTVFTNFEKQYMTSFMTEKEKAEKAAWYIGTTSDYDLYNSNWFDIFLKGKGDCYASRCAVQYMCSHMGIKALICRNYEAHG